jgi:hypothetical protein
MHNHVISIGKCGGCGRMGRLAHDDVCAACDAHLTPAQLVLSRHIRADPAFARACFRFIEKDADARASFVACFGAPPERGPRRAVAEAPRGESA